MAKTRQLLSTLASTRLLLVMFVALTVSAEVWGAEGIYKTALFGTAYNSKSVGSYTESWSATNEGFTVNLTNANNNNNGWSYIKMGRRNNASTGTITTAAAIDKAVTKVTLTIDDITSNNVTSITLKSATTIDGTYTSVGTFTKSTGTQTVTVSSPKTNLFYQIEVACTSGSSNGLITISRVDYYADLTPTATYDVSWVVNGEEIDITEDISEGSKVPSLPAEPEIDCSGKEFVGWSDQEVANGNKPSILFRDVANSPSITKQTTFYAVFAESGGSSVTTWSKTDISAINDGDEVVVVMNNGTNFALYDKNGTGSAPSATPITVSNSQIASPSADLVWVIEKSGDNLTFYQNDNKQTWLYCTNTNNGVRVGTNENKTFTIDASSGYLKHTGTSRYVGIYNSQDWRCYTGTIGTNIANQTLAFYAKTTTTGYQNYTTSCSTETSPSLNADPTSLAFGNVATDSNKEMTFTLTGSNLTANATLALSGTNESMFSVNPTSVTQSDGTIDQTDITVTYTPTATGSHNATLTISSTGAESKTVTLSGTGVAPAAKYTVTFNAGSGTCGTESLAEESAGAGVTLPTANPPATCATDGWKFAGWWTGTVAETTTSPGELLTAGSNYKPTSNCTLYAVYSKEETEEGGGTTPTDATLSFASKDQRTSFSSTQQVWEQNGIILTNTKGSDNNDANVGDYANPARFYANSEIIIEVSGNITQIVFECTENASELKNSVGVEATYNENIVTIIPTASSNTYTIAKLTKQVKMSSLTVTYLGAGGQTTTTTYNSNPSCEVCENILTINKGAETNGNTFTLSQSGNVETCDDDVEVVVTPTPAEHYSVASVTATTPTTTGDAPTVTNNGNDTWTVTYTQNSTGESTINVTFEEDAKASITLSELGVENTDNTTYYVGETYTLPSTSSQSCAGKQLVGWSTVEVAETDTKPTSNYYELGAEVTLAATQTFFAVFATEGEGGGGEYTLVTSANDFTDGVYVIAALDNGTYYFIDGQYTGDGIGVESTGLPVSKMSNNSFTELPSSAVEIEIEDDEDPDGENHYYFISYYDETISNLRFLDDNGTNKTLEWVEWFDGLTVYTYHPVFDSKTYLLSGSGAAISQNGSTKASFIRNYENGSIYKSLYFFKKTGSSTSYTAYTTSCIPTYSITYDFAGGTGSHCSNTSVPQGDTYTICDEAPTKEGYTFQGWSDGTSTYAAGATITPTKNTTLTAQWQIKTYTVTWSNNGATTPVNYNHGDALEVPAAPASCDGVKEFVGWTEQSGYYHATEKPDDLFTTKTDAVTAGATYYAVFATPGGTGSTNATTTLDFSAQGYNNEQAISSLTVNGVMATLAKGTNADNGPKYYDSGAAVRTYGGNTIKLSANNITAVTFTFGSGETADKNSNTISANTGSWEEPNWTGDAVNELVFTISGSTGHRRIQSIAVTHTTGSTAAHTDYTTICRQVESIEVTNPKTEFFITDDFTIGEGKVMAQFGEGESQDVTSLATFSGYNMNEVGTYTVTVTYMGATATYNIEVKPLDNAWVLTWNVSGKTNTGLGPRSVTKGSAIGTLPTPEIPAACEGKTFMGWTESNIVPSDGVGIEYIKPTTEPTDNTTYYAVFATVNNFSVQKPIEDIESGSKVVVVAVASLTADGGSGKAISSRTISITSQGVIGLSGDEVSISDETINTPHSTCIWTLTKEGGGIVLEQDGKYIRAVNDGYRKLLLETTKDYWTLTPVEGKYQTYHMQSGNTEHYVEWFDHTDDKYDEGEKYIGFVPYLQANDYGDFDMQFYVTANADGNADITDYTTGCEEFTITYYGFRGGYSTSTSSDGTIVLPVNSLHTIPNCEGLVINDHTNLGREFLNVWMTQPHGGHTFKPGDTFILTQDTTLYAQWKMETTSDVTTLPTDIEDLAGTDIYVYGGTTLNIQPGTTTINSLTLKGGLQSDGSYKMPTVWVPEGATLVRNSNKINLDLKVNAKNYYPFAVPFAAKNNDNVEYLEPELAAVSTYGTHFAIKTYDGARRADVGEDRANNWVRVLRGETLQPGVGYIISAMTYSGKDTATIRIPMTVPNTWFENGEQAEVGTTVRNTIAVTAHTGAAATEHQRHAGWNFVASPYLTNFAGGNVVNDGDLAYINGELTVNGGWQYGGDPVPYVTIPAYDFSYYTQHKLSFVKLSPEWSFFVQIGTSGTMDFSTAGRQETPASIAARHDAAQSFKMDVDITLSDKHHSDQMGLIICDRFTSAYEVGYDLEKMFGSAYNLTVYTLMEDNTPLAYHALAIHSNMQVIPVGYRVPEQGDYTFALNQSTSSIDLLNEQYEQLILVDYETGALTNLLKSTYTFTSPRTQSDSRFAIYAVIRQKTPTDLPNIDDGDTSTRKILHNGHLYILRDGKVYNGNGQIVK